MSDHNQHYDKDFQPIQQGYPQRYHISIASTSNHKVKSSYVESTFDGQFLSILII